MSRMLKKVYAAKRTINYDGGCKKAGTGAGIGRSGVLANFVRGQTNTPPPPVPAAPVVPVEPAAPGVVEKFFAYVANQGGSSISAFTIDETIGALTKIKVNNVTIPDIATNTAPFSITVNPTGKFAYVANLTSHNIRGYTIDQNSGALTRIGTVDFVTRGEGPTSLAVIGNFLYCANRTSKNIKAFKINQETGVLSTLTDANGNDIGSVFDVDANTFPRSIAVDSTGNFIYVASYAGNVSAFQINQTTGSLTRLTIGSAGTIALDITAGVNPIAVATTGRFVYVTNFNGASVSVYTINQQNGALTGALTRITNGTSGNPNAVDIACGLNPIFITIDPLGKFVYVANLSGGVSGYTINQTNGKLTRITLGTLEGFDIAAGLNPNSVNVDPTGKFLYVANNGESTVSAFTINQDTGALTNKNDFAAGSEPSSVITVRILYFAPRDLIYPTTNTFTVGTAFTLPKQSLAAGTDPIYTINPPLPTGLSINSNDGTITGTPPFSSLVNTAYTVTATNSAGSTSNSFTIKIDDVVPSGLIYPTTNTFTVGTAFTLPKQSLAAGTAPIYTITPPLPTGLSINSNTGTITGTPPFSSLVNTAYTVTATNSLGSTSASFTIQINAEIYKSFAYVANSEGNTISAFTVDQTSGALTKIKVNNVTINDIASGANPISITVNPTGKFAYVTNFNNSNIRGYTIDQTSGALTRIGTVDFLTQNGPNSLVVTGNFLYCANRNSVSISAFKINQQTGILSTLTDVNGTTPINSLFTVDSNVNAGLRTIAVDSTGNFIYAGIFQGDISAFQINQTTGSLTRLTIGSLGSFGSNIAAGQNPSAVATIGRFVYVANYSDSTVSVYTINQQNGALTGALTRITNGTLGNANAFDIACGSNPLSITIDPLGKFVYAGNSSAGVSGYTINQTNGKLTRITLGTLESFDIAADTTPNSVNVDPTGKFLYVANIGAQTVSTFTINQDTGALTKINDFASGANPSSVITVRFQYFAPRDLIYPTTNTFTEGTAFTLPKQSLAAGTDPIYTINPPLPTGLSINSNDGTITGTPPFSSLVNTAYTVTATNSLGSTSASFTIQINAVPDKYFAYVANKGNNKVSAYEIASNGTLSTIGNYDTGTQPVSVSVEPNGKFVYVANNGSSNISAYQINSSGALTLIGVYNDPNPFPIVSVTVDTTGKFVYAVCGTFSNFLRIFNIQLDGSLTFGTKIITGFALVSGTVSSNGKFLYIADVSSSAGENIIAFNIETGGTPTSIGRFGSLGTISSITATEKCVYVTDRSNVAVITYRIETNGSLTDIGLIPTFDNPVSISIEPTRRFAYVATDSGVSAYNNNLTTGAVAINIGHYTAGTGPTSVTVDPTGKFVYVANNGGNVSAFTINQSTGALSSNITGSPFTAGTNPKSIVTVRKNVVA